MENQLIEFLSKNWDKKFTKFLEFAPVPKGQKGDLAMKFFQLAKNTKTRPLELAQKIQKYLQNCSLVEATEIVGPYLNITFQATEFFARILNFSAQVNFLKNKNIVLEFSGPNTNKPLHLGHMRNHALGIAVSNILENCGGQVHRVNIINDRGIHICKSMLAYQKFGFSASGMTKKSETPETTGLKGDKFVGNFYVKFEQEVKKNPNLQNEVQEMLIKWENEDKEIRELWKKMNKWVLDGHAKTYRRQGVEFEKLYFESKNYQQGKILAKKGLKEKKFAKKSDGSIIIDLENEGLGEKIILRADGTSIYLTQDLAVAEARNKDFQNPDELIYIVADEQNYHFKVLFICLERLGIISREKCHHLGYGLVNLPDGRMKSREGTVVDADDLMDNLASEAYKKIQERNPDLSETKIREISEQIMNAAWKFYLLKTAPNKTITFDTRESIDFQGATGPYLQYAGVRIKSILRKIDNKIVENFSVNDLSKYLDEAEKPLGNKILEYQNVLARASETRNPTFLATYLLELAQVWASYYGQVSILNEKNEEKKTARIFLAKKVLEVLEQGLALLGIEVPEVM